MIDRLTELWYASWTWTYKVDPTEAAFDFGMRIMRFLGATTDCPGECINFLGQTWGILG